MSDAVLDEVIERIADGVSVDWSTLDQPASSRAREWARSLRVLNDIVKLHREAAAEYDQTALATMPAAKAAAVEEPETWGKYRLTTKVGEGSYGSVYRAWDADLEYDVAIKILHRRVGDTRQRERLLQEGRALAKVQHNNVVRVLGIEAHGDRVGLCMEFVRGKTLADIVRGQGRLSAAEAVLIGQDLCRALSAVHRAGFIHRDVKAKNVMRDDAGRIVLMDFGTGRAAEAQGGKGDRAGTPLYMAPEALEEGQASARSDVYSLGVLLYYLVTGEYPVNARSVEELRDAHANREHRWLSELRPDLPVAFIQVVERAIALDPDERYGNASELLAALNNLRLGSGSWFWRVAKPVIGVAAVVGVLTALGGLTSTAFNITLERSEFVNETLWDYLVWGRRSSFMPTVVFGLMLLVGAILVVVRRLLLAVSNSARRFDSALREYLRIQAHRHRLDEVPVLASFALLLSVVTVAATLWYFSPLLLAMMTNISTASPDQLALLSPSEVAYHNRFRQVLSVVVTFSVAVWYPVIRIARKGQSLPSAFVAGGVLSTCLALALLHVPYRLLYFNKAFEAVSFNGSRCYGIGERGDQLLLFCPDLPPPRNRTVDGNDARISRLGVTESIFSHIGQNTPTGR